MPDTGMQFEHTDASTQLDVHTHQQGSTTFTVNELYHGVAAASQSHRLTLGQVISLRDFLNRHIDHFALAATGSLAERSTDDPTQLSGEELIDLSRVTPYAVGDRQEFVLGTVALELVGEPARFTGADGINLHD